MLDYREPASKGWCEAGEGGRSASQGWGCKCGALSPSLPRNGSAEGPIRTKGTWWEQPLLGVE